MARRVDEPIGTLPDSEPRLVASAMTALMDLVRLWTSDEFQKTLAASADVEVESRDVPALFVLGLNARLQPSALARILRVSAGNVSKMTGRLSAAGYVVRTPVAHDARASWIELTPIGAGVVRRLHVQAELLLEGLLNDWDRKEIELFATVLIDLARRAGAVGLPETGTSARL